MRSKMEYALIENEKGKLQPQKMGLAPVQRNDLEYEFDIVLDINRNHMATASKDTTFLDKYGAVVTPELGRQIKAWLSQGRELDRCENCKCVIQAYKKMPASEIVQRSVEKYNKKLCAECVKNEAERLSEPSNTSGTDGVS